MFLAFGRHSGTSGDTSGFRAIFWPFRRYFRISSDILAVRAILQDFERYSGRSGDTSGFRAIFWPFGRYFRISSDILAIRAILPVFKRCSLLMRSQKKNQFKKMPFSATPNGCYKRSRRTASVQLAVVGFFFVLVIHELAHVLNSLQIYELKYNIFSKVS